MLKQLLPLLLLPLLLPSCERQSPYAYEHLYHRLPFDMPKIHPPVFPPHKASITAYGGIGNGITLNTQAFADAIDGLAEQGGGTLIVPTGVWLTGPIVFRSNIRLHLEKGALILFTPDRTAYPLIETSYEGIADRRCQSPLSGRNLENIALTGEGSINGSGEAWRPLKRDKVTEKHWRQVIASGGSLLTPDIWWPFEDAGFVRPVMLSFIECKNILLQGVLIENSPNWGIHPLMCENLIVDGIFARNPAYAQNGDGIDVESCKNVIIVNSTFDVGDDAICLKSGKDAEGRLRARPTENVIVDNCKVFKGHGGFVVGSEMSGGVRNVVVSNCQFLGTDVGLRFKSKRGRGGIVENIYIDRINMFDIITDSFLFDLYYGGKSASEALEDGDRTPSDEIVPPVTDETPEFRNIFVTDLVSRNARRALFFNGLPEMNISNIHLRNATITAELGAELSESRDITFDNITIIPARGPALRLNNVKNVQMAHIYTPGQETEVQITGDRNANIHLPEDSRAIVP
jgi:polygalacturonase